MNRLWPFLLLLLAFAAPARAQLPPGEKAMDVRLVAETDRPAAGGRVSLALLIAPKPGSPGHWPNPGHARPPTGGRLALALLRTPKPGWHGYWQNPGDAGAPTRIAWTVPGGAKAGPLRYPVPGRLVTAGLMNYVNQGPYADVIDPDVPAGRA